MERGSSALLFPGLYFGRWLIPNDPVSNSHFCGGGSDLVLRFHGTGTGGVVMFILVKGLVLVMLSLVLSSFSMYSPLELMEILERA